MPASQQRPDGSNQIQELEDVAARHKWNVIGIYTDRGVIAYYPQLDLIDLETFAVESPRDVTQMNADKRTAEQNPLGGASKVVTFPRHY
jgi:hypothetical protein